MISERITTWVATLAIASPWWLPSLTAVSETFSMLLPVAGVVWIGVQIAAKVKTTKWRGDED